MISKTEEIWLTCPICKSDLKSKNFSKHLSNTHSDISDEKRKMMIAFKKKAKKMNGNFNNNNEINSKKSKFIWRKEINSVVKSRIKKVAMAVGIILIVFLVAYNSVIPAESGNKNQNQSVNLGSVCEVPIEVTGEVPKSWSQVPAPGFRSTDVLTGQSVALDQFEGDLVLLNFVNYGCNPQINEIVSAQLLLVRDLWNNDMDFKPLSVFCGCCPVETLKNFAQQNEFNWTWILDSDYSIIKLYRDYVSAYGYPTLVFIDDKGIVQDVTGYLNESSLTTKINEYI